MVAAELWGEVAIMRMHTFMFEDSLEESETHEGHNEREDHNEKHVLHDG